MVEADRRSSITRNTNRKSLISFANVLVSVRVSWNRNAGTTCIKRDKRSCSECNVRLSDERKLFQWFEVTNESLLPANKIDRVLSFVRLRWLRTCGYAGFSSSTVKYEKITAESVKWFAHLVTKDLGVDGLNDHYSRNTKVQQQNGSGLPGSPTCSTKIDFFTCNSNDSIDKTNTDYNGSIWGHHWLLDFVVGLCVYKDVVSKCRESSFQATSDNGSLIATAKSWCHRRYDDLECLHCTNFDGEAFKQLDTIQILMNVFCSSCDQHRLPYEHICTCHVLQLRNILWSKKSLETK